MVEKLMNFFSGFEDPMLLVYAAPVVAAVLYFLVSAIGQSGE